MSAVARLGAVCLMGPTASRKTELAIRLAAALPLDIISVDSAMVYRSMDIGTAKPDRHTLARAPHRLIDIREPEDAYSAGDFVRDARSEIESIHAQGRIPLLVGGTMMYFRALTDGMAALPGADAALRAAIDAEAAASGWPEMHRLLAAVDPVAARRIGANDSQRIQRALEVYRATGKALSQWHLETRASPSRTHFVKIALVPDNRGVLHRRIEDRLAAMLEAGFVEEVRRLRLRPSLSRDSASMRAVGYRQLWAYLDGDADRDAAIGAALAATRQLAKRQLTWLRSDRSLTVVNPLESNAFASIESHVGSEMQQF